MKIPYACCNWNPRSFISRWLDCWRVQRVGDNEVRHKQPAHPGGVSTVKREGIWQLDCVKSTIVQCKQTKRLLTGQQWEYFK